MDNTAEYEFNNETDDEYSMSLTLNRAASNFIFAKVYAAALRGIRGKNINAVPVADLTEIPIPMQFYNLLKVGFASYYKNCKRELEAEKVKLLTWRIDKADFVRHGKDWKISVKIKGDYIDNG